jgi:hypothetical protein
MGSQTFAQLLANGDLDFGAVFTTSKCCIHPYREFPVLSIFIHRQSSCVSSVPRTEPEGDFCILLLTLPLCDVFFHPCIAAVPHRAETDFGNKDYGERPSRRHIRPRHVTMQYAFPHLNHDAFAIEDHCNLSLPASGYGGCRFHVVEFSV